MNRIRLPQLLDELRPEVTEVMPWDIAELHEKHPDLLIVDIRESYEFEAMRLAGSISIPRGILELACEWDYEETEPELAEARDRPVLLVCRSGNRTVFAAYNLQRMGFHHVYSLSTGLKGWNDFELPLVDKEGHEVDVEMADEYFEPLVRPDQIDPARRDSTGS
ncbi:MAG: rhodanese-like domain-containing protein [Pseudomonadota bacterium]|nr:rhodanese-like domain-containing protein [Pseudomonadota bacterium]